MPIVRKLNPQEVQTLEYKGKGQRKLVEEQYDAFLAGYEVGDYGEAELEQDESRLTVKNRFKAAAARRGLDLTFQRTNGNLLRFRIAPGAMAEAEVVVPSAEEPEPPKGRGGRKRAAVGAVG
jgi:hypothetical protein